MRIVVLDGFTLNPGDLNWKELEKMGSLTVYDRTGPVEVNERISDAEVVLSNKTVLTASHFQANPKIEYVGIMATGFNNIDLKAASENGITVTNAAGYSTLSVVQHTFSLLLAILNRPEAHGTSVRSNAWAMQKDFSYTLQTVHELAGKTMGIYGFGTIGQEIAKIAAAFGMKVIYTNRSGPIAHIDFAEWVPLETLFSSSDVLSLHSSLSSENEGIVNLDRLKTMKPGSVLLNTARGGLINETDLLLALNEGYLHAAGLDVLSEEPPAKDHPLAMSDKCLITPHMAWASKESRQRLMKIVADNLRNYLMGTPQNVING